MIKIHGSAVEINGKGVLLIGSSGAGKSDLALRLIDGGARLIADDYTIIEGQKDGSALMSSPDEISGLIEVRGLGLMKMPYTCSIPLHLVFELTPYGDINRMPDLAEVTLDGVTVPQRQLDPFMASAAATVRLAALQDELRSGYE
ncbi:MAG: serine kinase [Sneathiella sp.]|nr:MAG: serine kinase [Sneathiella sp.]